MLWTDFGRGRRPAPTPFAAEPHDASGPQTGSARTPGRATRTAIAFGAVIAFAELTPAIPHHPAARLGWWMGGVALTLTAAVLSLVVHADRRGRWIRYLPLLVFLAAVQALRAADGNGSAGFTPLLILPVIWYALYGNRLAVYLALAGVAAVQFGPLIVVGAPEYPVTLWRGGILWVVILALTGLVAHRLVAAFRGKTAALAASEARFRTAFSDAPTGVVLVGASGSQTGVFLHVNRAMAAMLGRREDEMINHSILDFTHPDDRVLSEQILLAPEERQVAQQVEKRYLHSSGKAVPVAITYTRIQSRPGDVPCLIAHVVDITERRAAQLEMLTALDEEKQANAQLKRVDRARAELVASVAYEIDEPLAGIMHDVDTLRSDAESALSAPHQQRLAGIEQSIDRLARIVERLRTLPRLEDEAADQPSEPVKIEPVVRAAIDSIRPIARSHELALQTDLSLADAQVSGDAAKIERVLMNLLDNAVKFTPPGGAVDAQARIRGDAVVIDVSDTGIGISSEEQDRIFERFYRAAEVTRQSIPGAGLGLAIAKAITDQYHGTINVFSEPGAGSTFTFTLPLHKEHAVS